MPTLKVYPDKTPKCLVLILTFVLSIFFTKGIFCQSKFGVPMSTDTSVFPVSFAFRTPLSVLIFDLFNFFSFIKKYETHLEPLPHAPVTPPSEL